MKLYIAGPMTGLPEFNYPAFEEARQLLEGAGYEVLCPTDSSSGHEPGEMPYHWYLREDLKMLLECEGVAVLPDAACSNGAVLEVTVARAIGMEIKTVSQWMRDAGTGAQT